uniref:Reverse transcriptase domain-containing protein n=1 Tax=Tanacetum cinerariifolium TaxID=118510 RepID=A0A6L2KZ90_TANCI|nr:hypothetical protein [Tanacetum cinerariifolium]
MMVMIVNSSYEQEPSYNQNYDDNYYPHESPSYPCCDYCGGSHETLQCQPDNQNVDFSDSYQIQTPQYLDVNPPSPEISNEEIFQAKGDLMKSIQTFLERFNCIPFEEKPQILFQTWETFFAIQCSQPEDSNELFQKLLKDLKELAETNAKLEFDFTSLRLIGTRHGNEGHYVQDKESLENPFNEIAVSKPDNESELELEATTDTELSGTEDIHPLVVQEPPQDSDIHQLIEECSVEVPEQQKQKMEDTIQPEHLLSMGYEHPSITPETESDEVKESIAENLLPIPSKCEVTLEDEIECDMPYKDDCSLVFTTFSNPLFKDNDDLDSSDDESLPDEDVPAEEFKIYSNLLFDEDEINSDKLDPYFFNVESDFVESLLNRDTFIDFSSKFDFSEELYAEIADTIIESIPLPIPVQDGNSQQEEINIVTDDVLPPSVENDDDDFDLLLGEADLFLVFDDSIPPGIENFSDDPEGDVRLLEELLNNDSILSHESYDSNFKDNPSIPRPPPEPPDERLINLVENDIPDNSIPPGIENVANDPEGDICFLEELLIIDSIFSHESSDSKFEDNPLIPRPPPEPPDVETDIGEEIAVVIIDNDDS